MVKNKLETLIPSAVALAMGVASIVLLILNGFQETIVTLLAIGVLCLAFLRIKEL